MLLYLGYLILRKIVRFHFINYILFFLIDSIVIINNSPIENNNKPLRKELIERLKVKTVYIVTIFDVRIHILPICKYFIVCCFIRYFSHNYM